MSSASQANIFLGRQPILGIRQEIVAYELLFRSADVAVSDYASQDLACISVIENVLSGFGLRHVLGDKDGYFNITETVLLSELVEILPQEQVVLELVEDIPFNDIILKRVLELKSRGFRLALDDYVYSSQHGDICRLMDVIKINLLETSPELLRVMARELRNYPVRLLAECVETAEQFKECRELGFELFQGYFFERPAVLRRQGLETSKIGMLRLLDSLKGDMVVAQVEAVFRDHPDLSYGLLKLVNSVHINLREKIGSLRHAIMILGLENLRRWARLTIFVCSDSRGVNNPLLEMAAVRGRLMEYLIMRRHGLPRSAELVESAFMTGIMSLVDVLFGVSMEEIVGELHLNDAVSRSLLHRSGELGDLLSLSEALERVDFGALQRFFDAGAIPLAGLLEAQLVAYNWRSSMWKPD